MSLAVHASTLVPVSNTLMMAQGHSWVNDGSAYKMSASIFSLLVDGEAMMQGMRTGLLSHSTPHCLRSRRQLRRSGRTVVATAVHRLS